MWGTIADAVAISVAEEKAFKDSIAHLPESERTKLIEQRAEAARNLAETIRARQSSPSNSGDLALAGVIGLIVGVAIS